MHDPEEHSKGENIGLNTLIGLIISLVLHLRGHVHFCSNPPLEVLTNRGDHSEVAELKAAVLADEHVFEFDVEVGEASLCVKSVHSTANL